MTLAKDFKVGDLVRLPASGALDEDTIETIAATKQQLTENKILCAWQFASTTDWYYPSNTLHYSKGAGLPNLGNTVIKDSWNSYTNSCRIVFKGKIEAIEYVRNANPEAKILRIVRWLG